MKIRLGRSFVHRYIHRNNYLYNFHTYTFRTYYFRHLLEYDKVTKIYTLQLFKSNHILKTFTKITKYLQSSQGEPTNQLILKPTYKGVVYKDTPKDQEVIFAEKVPE